MVSWQSKSHSCQYLMLMYQHQLIYTSLVGSPQAEALCRNLIFVQRSMVAGGLATIAGHLLQNDLITQQNYNDALAVCGRGPLEQATILTNSILLKIKYNPENYFPLLIESLRQSGSSDAADTLVQEQVSDCWHYYVIQNKTSLV